MSKIKAVSSNKLLYSFALKTVISSVLSVLLGIVIFSVLIYRLDISLELTQYFGIVIVIFSSISKPALTALSSISSVLKSEISTKEFNQFKLNFILFFLLNYFS